MPSKKKKLTSRKDPASVAQRFRNMKEGIEKVFPASKMLDLEGTPTSQPDSVSRIDRRLVPFDRVDAIRIQLSKAVADRDATLPEAIRDLEAFEAAVVSTIGARSPRLTDFGLEPKADPDRTAKSKADAAKKAAETREARDVALGKKKPKTPPPSPEQ